MKIFSVIILGTILLLSAQFSSFGQSYQWNQYSKLKKLPKKNKGIVKSLSIMNYKDSVFPTDFLLQFENLEELSVTVKYKKKKGTQILDVYDIKIDTNKLKKMPRLKYIGLAGIRLKNFPVELSVLDSLKSINLFLTDLESIPAEIKDFKNLKELILIGNRIEYIHPDIVKLDSLKSLQLQNNRFTKFPSCILDIPNIEEINLINYVFFTYRGNQIDYFKIIPEIEKALKIPSLKGFAIDVETCRDMKRLKDILKDNENYKKLGIDYEINDCIF